jgi:hypothetical protein
MFQCGVGATFEFEMDALPYFLHGSEVQASFQASISLQSSLTLSFSNCIDKSSSLKARALHTLTRHQVRLPELFRNQRCDGIVEGSSVRAVKKYGRGERIKKSVFIYVYEFAMGANALLSS